MDLPNLQMNIPDLSYIHNYEFRKHNPAEGIFDKILEQISEFENNLGDEHEVGGVLVGSAFSQFYISKIKKGNPDMIIFYGETESGPIQVLQHISQINISLISLKKQKEHKEARRIGFKLD